MLSTLAHIGAGVIVVALILFLGAVSLDVVNEGASEASGPERKIVSAFLVVSFLALIAFFIHSL